MTNLTKDEQKLIDDQNKKLEEIQKIAEEKMDWTNLKTIDLDDSETSDIDSTFDSIQDFRSLWEKITAPIDNIVEKTSKIIENDPIMDVSDTLNKVNKDVQEVYKEIVNDDWTVMKFLKSIPVIGSGISKLDNKVDDMKFDMQETKWKIETIFSGFDQSYTSLNKSVDMQKEFLDGLEDNLWKVESYKIYVEKKLESFKEKAENMEAWDEKEKYKMFADQVQYFVNNLQTLVGNLELAKKRLLIRLDSAVKLSLSMNSSRPIFKTLLSVAIIETSWQKALDASMKSMDKMSSTIDKMSSELTDKTIESSKEAEKISQKPALDTKVFVENVEKLKKHFEEIEDYRAQVAENAKQEREAFSKAEEELKSLQKNNRKDYDELQEELNKQDEKFTEEDGNSTDKNDKK